MKETATSPQSTSIHLRLLMAGVLATACSAIIGDNAVVPTLPRSDLPTALAITHCACAGGCLTVDFETPNPLGRHRLEESHDLRKWQPVPIATFGQLQAGTLRTVVAGVTAQTAFYRVALAEASASNAPVYVNLQVDAELDDTVGLRTVTSELQRRQITATVFVSADYANRNALFINELFRTGFEIALHGYYAGDETKYGYWQPVLDFLDAARGQVTFVQSKDLVDRR